MHLSSDDAAVIYARACFAWYGSRAPRIIMERVTELRESGDHAGAKAWIKVADKLSHLQKKLAQRKMTAGHNGKLY